MLAREFTQNSVPAVLGTKREKIIARAIGIEDPYKVLKDESNKIAQDVAKRLFSSIDLNDLAYENFRKIMLIASAANAVEWFIRGYEFSMSTFERELLASLNKLAIDDSKELYNLLQGGADSILYVLDNAGEAVIDLYVVKYLRMLSDRVYVGARAAPVLNDVTVEEAKALGFGEHAEVIPVGDFVGIILECATEKFKKALDESTVIIAKGMGAYETLTEYKLDKPTFVLLKAKCEPVARSLNVPQGSLVIKRLF